MEFDRHLPATSDEVTLCTDVIILRQEDNTETVFICPLDNEVHTLSSELCDCVFAFLLSLLGIDRHGLVF